MKMRLSEVYGLLEPLVESELRDTDGRRYTGHRSSIVTVLIGKGISKPERDAIIGGRFPATKGIIQMLVRAGVLHARPTPHVPSKRSARALADRKPRSLSVAAESAYDAAIRDYASTWSAEDDDEAVAIAPDAAEGFFAEYPEWRKWASELGLSREDIKSAVVDQLYDVMTR